MNLIVRLSLVHLFSQLVHCQGQNPSALQVITDYGKVQGGYLEASDGKLLAGFLGVPYARPPLGDLRFRPPQSPTTWSGIRDASKMSPSCVQRKDSFFGDFSGSTALEPLAEMSEDCLYLNIYVPNVMATLTNETAYNGIYDNGLPVLVWFHGGGFTRGSSFPKGSQGWSPDPKEIAVKGEIMVVTVQYRLGSFGFLYLDDEGAPGNVGLLDQKKALAWLKTNIYGFGGDPSKITLAGQDAGGISTALHALTADTIDQRLYQRLIIQSAGLQEPWSYIEPKEALRRAQKLASLVGCPTDEGRQELIHCLTRVPSEKILNMEMGVARSGLDYYPFVLTRDGSFLKEHPKELLNRLQDREFPLRVLMGTNQDEGSKSLMYSLPHLFPNRELKHPSLTSDQFSAAIEKLFRDSGEQVQDIIRFQYTNWSYPSGNEDHFTKLTQLVGDSYYKCSSVQLADKLSERYDVFSYRFAVRNPTDVWPKWTGVKHGDELDYIFGRPMVQRDKFRDTDLVVSAFMLKSWTNFVKLGHPSGSRGRGKTLGWPKYTPASKQVLFFGEDSSVVIDTVAETENCMFWNHLVPSMEKASIECSRSSQYSEGFVKKKLVSSASQTNPVWTFTKGDTMSTPSARLESTPVPKNRVVAHYRPLGNRPYFLVRKSTPVPKTTSTTTTTAAPNTTPKPMILTASFQTVPFQSRVPDMTAASSMLKLSERDPTPLNSLQRHSILGADRPQYKVVRPTAEYAIVREEQRQGEEDGAKEQPKRSMPENKELSYSLSVASQAAPPSSSGSSSASVWTLYKPDAPGNSPIYVATGAFNSPRETTRPPRPTTTTMTTTTTTTPPRSFYSYNPIPRERPIVRNRYNNHSGSNKNSGPPLIYDPFNVAEYSNAYTNRRKRKNEEEALAEQQRSPGLAPFYYPNYVSKPE